MIPNLDQLPAAIIHSARGVVMKLESRDGKQTKVPYQAHRTSDKAAVDNPATWRPFMVVYDAVADGKCDGAGIVLGDRLVGVDIDRCRDPETGDITPDALAVIRDLDSYTEISMSGTGVHVLVYGDVPPGGRRRHGIELYSERRYFVVTGHHLPWTPTDILERTAPLRALYARLAPPEPSVPRAVHATATTLDDATVLHNASTATNGATFTALWHGDVSLHGGDDSAADLALCNLLAFWTGRDGDQVDRLFRQSGLMRPKWDSRRGDTTYGEITIAKAIADTVNVYVPAITVVIEDDDDHAAPMRDPATVSAPGGDGWPTLHADARIGLFGDLVDLLAPQTESDPVALLAHALVLFGNVVGRTPRMPIGADRHHLNDNLLCVGDTSVGRKGLAYADIHAVVSLVDPAWAERCVLTGLSSGEGVIHAVRDAVDDQEPVKAKGGQVLGYQTVVVDTGVTDKRLAVIESEFGKVLRVSRRDGNTLSAVIRQAWDHGTLRVMTRHSPIKATDAHISLIGHITPRELCQELKSVDMASGFINRFLIVLVRRSQCLPDGGQVDVAARATLVRQFKQAVVRAAGIETITRDDDARAHWHAEYPHLTRARAGLVGAICNRAPAHVVRLACIYALADSSSTIRLAHQQAALAVWTYAESSVTKIFGRSVGDPLADYLVQMLRGWLPAGLTLTEISEALGRHRPAEAIHAALRLLTDFGHAYVVKEPVGKTGGRPAHRWFAVDLDAK